MRYSWPANTHASQTFIAIGKKFHATAVEAVQEHLAKARIKTKEMMDRADVAIMYDGTWQKRGHRSHNGIGTAVSVGTGLCLDFEVLLNLAYSRHQDLGAEEEIWQAFHSPVCEKNTECSSHAMETEAALCIWCRTPSYETPLRFTKFLSDGDSKAYTAVTEDKAYGEVVVDKEDCTNHVGKRLGTATRKAPNVTSTRRKVERWHNSEVVKLLSYCYNNQQE